MLRIGFMVCVFLCGYMGGFFFLCLMIYVYVCVFMYVICMDRVISLVFMSVNFWMFFIVVLVCEVV